MQPIIYNVQQGSEEWFALRRGKMTASHAQAIASAGKGLETYASEIAAELYTGKGKKIYKNAAMQNGNDTEHIVRVAYEMYTGYSVQQVGFVQYNEHVGCSPDGLVGTDGGVEIKSRDSDGDSYSLTHLKLLLGEEDFESGYIWQCHMNMLELDRKWWDLISFDPSFKDKSLFVKRIYRDETKDSKLLNGFEVGKNLVQKKFNQLISIEQWNISQKHKSQNRTCSLL